MGKRYTLTLAETWHAAKTGEYPEDYDRDLIWERDDPSEDFIRLRDRYFRMRDDST